MIRPTPDARLGEVPLFSPFVMFTLADFFGHLSNLIYAVGSSIKGSLALRVSLIVGASIEIMYDLYITTEPLWTSIFWCLIIIALNIYQVILILLYRRKSGLNTREQELYNELFRAMDLSNFRKMMKTARWEVLPENRVVIVENEPADRLFLLSKGVAEVSLMGRPIAQIRSGSFIGEMSLLTGQMPNATVRVRQGATLISWTKHEIHHLQETDENLNNELYAVFSRDIIEKIKLQNLQSAC